MTTILLVLTLILPSDDPARSQTPRKPNPFAPSLPLLTEAEEAELDRIIDRYILTDIGKLKGAEAKQAIAEFNKLGPEATLALIRGVNRAAEIEQSCPVVLIARKLAGILGASRDQELLQFARENVGAGVRATKHKSVLNQLRVLCSTRKAVLTRVADALPRTPPGRSATSTLSTVKPPRHMTIAELAAAAGSARGARLKAVLAELGNRSGDEVLAALGSAAATYESDVRQLAREQLGRVLARLRPDALKEKLKDDRAEVRAAAGRLAGSKELRFGSELIDLLDDADAGVRQAAHQALVRLSKGVDFGPAKDAGDAERAAAVKQWRAWWAKQK